MMKIYEKIRFMRELKNWSQEEMATKLSMSVNGYANIERGETDIQLSRLEQIAKTLEIELLELLSFGENNIFYLTGDNNRLYKLNINSSNKQSELENELEKTRLIVEQQQKEIDYLKEIINLMKNKET